MSNLPGFASAQRAWENMEPAYASDCDCPPMFLCERCDEYSLEAGACKNCKDEDFDAEDGPGVCVPVDREDSTFEANQNCAQHGWCGGCSSRNCEDCNG